MKVHGVRALIHIATILKFALLTAGLPNLTTAADPPSVQKNHHIVRGYAQSMNRTTDGSRSYDLTNLPKTILEDGIENWVVDRFAGNNTAGPIFYQGPAREVGSLQNPFWSLEGADGTIYLVIVLQGAVVPKIMKVDTEGTLRLFMDDKGLLEGRLEECQAGWPVWNPKEKALYLVGRHCLRKVVEKPDGTKWVEVVAGVPSPTPGLRVKREPRDGPAKQAVFTDEPRYGVVCNSTGTFYWLEDTDVTKGLRKIENGRVSTVPLHFKEQGEFLGVLYEGGMLSLGENHDTLYISSIYDNKAIFRCDLKSGELVRVCGIREQSDAYQRKGKEADGPALTHAAFNGSAYGLYDPSYHAIWLWGQDHIRVRWLRLDGDGWVRTVFGTPRAATKRQFDKYKDTNALGVPGEQFRLGRDAIIKIAGIDSHGGVYLIMHHHEGSGFWRAYHKSWRADGKQKVTP